MTPAEPVHAAPGTSSRCTRASSWRPPFRNTRDTAAMSAASSELLLLSMVLSETVLCECKRLLILIQQF